MTWTGGHSHSLVDSCGPGGGHTRALPCTLNSFSWPDTKKQRWVQAWPAPPHASLTSEGTQTLTSYSCKPHMHDYPPDHGQRPDDFPKTTELHSTKAGIGIPDHCLFCCPETPCSPKPTASAQPSNTSTPFPLKHQTRNVCSQTQKKCNHQI